MGLRDKILAYGKASGCEPVETPEWPELDGQVYVRRISAAELDAFFADDKTGNFRGRFAALVACDADGHRLFSEDDAGTLGEMTAAVIDRIAGRGQKINGLLKEQREAAEKN